jgi:hypothetical protein
LDFFGTIPIQHRFLWVIGSLTIGGIIAVLAIAVRNADPFIVRDFSGRKFICGITSKLLQIHQETLWRRPKNISNVAFTSSLSEKAI